MHARGQVGWFALVMSLQLAGNARAVPMPPFPITLHDADGSTVTARVFGDERLSWAEALTGYALAYDKPSGSWRYATRGFDGRLVPSSLRPGHGDPRTLGVAVHLAPQGEAVQRARLQRSAAGVGPRPDPGPRVVHNLTLLVKFSNQTNHFQPADFDPILNGAANSVRAFYLEISYGQFDLSSTVVGWIQLPHPDTYYAWNEEVDNPAAPSLMLWDAVAWLDQQGFDFTAFDSDGDGVIDAVDLIHSGESYETTLNAAYIHSHYSALGPGLPSPTTHDGKTFSGYHTEPEFGPDGNSITHIGVICHETAHFFGAPDLYDLTGQSSGLGLWSLMAMGPWAGPGMDGSVPTHPDAYSRALLGFTAPVTLSADATQLRLSPADTVSQAYRIDTEDPSQYFMLEDRQPVGFDRYLPGGGMLVFHVDETQSDETNPDDYLVDLEQADGKRKLNTSSDALGDACDAYPCHANNRFTPDSTPSSIAYRQTSSRIWVTNIARSGTDVTFDLAFHDPLKLGSSCANDGECASLHCASGVCCDAACAEDCHACAEAKGAIVDGHCSGLTGTACDDHDPCTTGDICSLGVCRGSPLECPADACRQAGSCQAGSCVAQPNPDGTPCDDGNLCTERDQCESGHCQPGALVICAASDACHLPGACDPLTGLCTSPKAADGTGCTDGDGCTPGDACLDGACKPGQRVSCPDPAVCHLRGDCDPATGTCSDPVVADGTTCDDNNPCTSGDLCHAGVCLGQPLCQPADSCHVAGTCDPVTATCSTSPVAPDGTACGDWQACSAGVCLTKTGCGCGTGAEALVLGVLPLLLALVTRRRVTWRRNTPPNAG